ncbi:MAG: YceG family protein [Treponema sp.]|nr:YceG family protein [Treponema sp.]
MFTHIIANSFDDFFSALSKRDGKHVYFYRVNDYAETVKNLITKFYELAKQNGVVIEGGIPAPDQKNLSYYKEMMGDEFKPSIAFMDAGLKKWLPRMNDVQRHDIAMSLLATFQDMLKAGKNESIIKNTYIKFLCWLYYKFERVLVNLGNNDVPKIIYEGNITNHELLLLSILSKAGCDILLLQYKGDAAYLKLDPKSDLSTPLLISGGQPFPADFSLSKLRQNAKKEMVSTRLYGALPSLTLCTNAWIERQRGLEIIKEPTLMRGKEEKFVYNAFMRINGAEDKYIYSDQLYRMQQDLKNSKRHLVIVNGKIPNPTPEEIGEIRRGNYANTEQLILNITQNISYGSNIELQKLMRKAFVNIMLEESQKENANVNKLSSKAVYLLCWLKRYAQELFSNWKHPEVGVFIYLGGCKNENESNFLRMLARIPVDVLILCPNLNSKCCLSDDLLYEENNTESLNLEKYPEDSAMVRMGTVASHAEREFTDLMCNDSNSFYRNQQFSKANSIKLQTRYEEIHDMWDVTVNFRQFFRVENNLVDIPVIFAKISGVKDGNLDAYWDYIRELKTDNSMLITKIPYIESGAANKFKGLAAGFYKNGKLLKDKIKNHPDFPYAILREEMQNHIVDKIELLINSKLIKGIGENGTEYTIIGWCLNLPKEIVRLIQSFDFTKKNPKLIFVNTTDKILSLEDTIITTFLNLIGFDILFFVPTGYQCVEKYFTTKLMEEHQIGEYQYDLSIPDLTTPPINKASKLLKKLFGRGK